MNAIGIGIMIDHNFILFNGAVKKTRQVGRMGERGEKERKSK